MVEVISVLCPSRGRPDMLRASVASLRDLASDPANVQILVAADPDDQATIDVASELDLFTLVPAARIGYAHLYVYYNLLAMHSGGDWLLLWNDDATMTTQGWDLAIENAPAEALVADLQHNLSPAFVCFPAIRRSLYEALGCYSAPTPHVDSYLQDIGRALGAVRPVDAHVHHDRPDLTGRTPDATYTDGRSGLRHEHYFSPEFQAEIADAVERVREALCLPA